MAKIYQRRKTNSKSSYIRKILSEIEQLKNQLALKDKKIVAKDKKLEAIDKKLVAIDRKLAAKDKKLRESKIINKKLKRSLRIKSANEYKNNYQYCPQKIYSKYDMLQNHGKLKSCYKKLCLINM